MRRFNTAGPCRPALHYTLPASARMPTVRALVDQQAYFVVHAPRQTGKTTSLLSLAVELTAEGRYCAVLLSLEVGAWASDDPGAAESEIVWQVAQMPTEVRTVLNRLPAVGEDTSGPLGPGLLATGAIGSIVVRVQTALRQ